MAYLSCILTGEKIFPEYFKMVIDSAYDKIDLCVLNAKVIRINVVFVKNM